MKWKLIQALPRGGLLVRTSSNFTVICILSFPCVIGRDSDSVLNLVSTQSPPDASDADTHDHSLLRKWNNGRSPKTTSPPPRENLSDSSARRGFSFLPDRFISHLTVFSTRSMSCGSCPHGAHSVFSFPRTDSFSEGEMWGALKPSLKWSKIATVYKAADWIIWKRWWMLKTKQNKNLCTEWNHQCVSKGISLMCLLSMQSLMSHQRKNQASHCKVLEICT